MSETLPQTLVFAGSEVPVCVSCWRGLGGSSHVEFYARLEEQWEYAETAPLASLEADGDYIDADGSCTLAYQAHDGGVPGIQHQLYLSSDDLAELRRWAKALFALSSKRGRASSLSTGMEIARARGLFLAGSPG